MMFIKSVVFAMTLTVNATNQMGEPVSLHKALNVYDTELMCNVALSAAKLAAVKYLNDHPTRSARYPVSVVKCERVTYMKMAK